ncbi:MAG: TolC family protein [Mariniblastus sp.]
MNQDAMPTKVDSSVPAGKLLGVQEARTKFSNSFANAYDGIGNSAPPVANNPAVRNNASQGIRVADNSFPATSFRGGNTFPANPPQPNLNVRLPANGNSSVDGSWSTVEGSFGNLESIQDTASSKMVVGAGSDSTTIWWKEQVLSPMHGTNGQQKVDTNTLVYQTLQRSPRIRALSQDPLIRELQVIEADSDFDPVSFIRSQFQDRNDPVGDQLSVTADGSDFLQDHIWTADLGVRKKLRTGASYELNQTLGFKNSNSNFFVPQDQGTATLALNVTQPLLRGRGRYYNQSQILIAQSAGGVAWNTFIGELQDEIQKTVDAYWQLYTDRCVYLQKQRNVARGETILGLLEGRAGLDSLPSQIARARSAVQSRRTDLANALRDVRNSETEIRRLTADRNWQANRDIELLPIEFPSNNQFALELEQVVFTALNHRPEIKQTMTRAKIAGIQKDISVNELLPELSLLLGTYVSALKGESNLGQAIQDQFGEVTPGYSVGFEFELPIRNRAARSRLSQRKLQLAKIKAEVDETMQNVVAESQVSLRRVTSARETLDSALPAIEAARADLDQNIRRWESFALIEGDLADGQTPTTVLDQLLDSQERLTAAELVYTQSELELKTAEIALQRAMGTLLMHQSVTFQSGYDADVPTLQINQGR